MIEMNRLKLPGRFYELNIHYGLFVGGLGNFREIFLGLWDNFRGCIQQLLYNGQDLLAQLKNNKQVSYKVEFFFSSRIRDSWCSYSLYYLW